MFSLYSRQIPTILNSNLASTHTLLLTTDAPSVKIFIRLQVNLKIISDSRIRSIIAKGPKYRFPGSVSGQYYVEVVYNLIANNTFQTKDLGFSVQSDNFICMKLFLSNVS